MSSLTPVPVDVVKIQLFATETWYLIIFIDIMPLIPIDLLFTAHRLNTAGWLLGSSTIEQKITFGYEVSQNRSNLNMRTTARAIPMTNWFSPSYVHEHTTYTTTQQFYVPVTWQTAIISRHHFTCLCSMYNCFLSMIFQASATKYIRNALFWVIIQRLVVIYYQCVETTKWSHL